jgi:Autographiviridae endonuclease VII
MNPNEYQREYRRKNGPKLNARAKELRKANPQKKYFEILKNRYGVSREWFYKQLEKQDGRCVCGFVFSLFTGDRNRSPHVDHNHETGRVRGLLCSRCNTSIGLLQLDKMTAAESFALLSKIMNYLRA